MAANGDGDLLRHLVSSGKRAPLHASAAVHTLPSGSFWNGTDSPINPNRIDNRGIESPGYDFAGLFRATRPFQLSTLNFLLNSGIDVDNCEGGPGLKVCGEIVKAIRINFDNLPAFNFIPFVRPAYNAIFRRLTAQDQDQEVTECAISCLGLVIPMLGDHLKSVLDT
uniref:Uncharacterized protein n=1 Tax=Physcomitrium patens TaxID=3218 RepID=A0A2K1IQQ4_PHYPA|nr:hypothetical protein PHYPA_025732 [Physcomitrium patens]